MRRFAIIGHRAQSSGKLPLSDLASGAGRMDVLIRALMASLMTSHGFRKDSEIILHLWGGPGPKRRLKIIGSEVIGLHAEERSIAGQIGKILKEPVPPIGSWTKRSVGIYDSGGSIQETIREWEGSIIVALDADAERLWSDKANIPLKSNPHSFEFEQEEELIGSGIDIGFILSDDQTLDLDDHNGIIRRSLGQTWLQGHMAIGICHFLIDEGVGLNL
jgi:tRNA (pseudouridine54-N1)-methyltransferase